MIMDSPHNEGENVNFHDDDDGCHVFSHEDGTQPMF